jgi:hypothetical protein
MLAQKKYHILFLVIFFIKLQGSYGSHNDFLTPCDVDPVHNVTLTVQLDELMHLSTGLQTSRVELGLTQARLMKIRVESSRARETVRAEKPSSSSARYYSS